MNDPIPGTALLPQRPDQGGTSTPLRAVPPFTKGTPYHRNALLAHFAADDAYPLYVLQKAGEVLAFTVNRWQNPQAPAEILVGCDHGREPAAEQFIQAGRSVPVFIRETEESKDWSYAGTFALDHASDDIAEKNQRVKPFDIPNIYKILFLKEVTT